jgi:transcription elongation GreA/GreB family factor
MSKAFTKEDVEPAQRSGRVRTASGLPPGATNYITAAGARRLQQELENLRTSGEGNQAQIDELAQILASVTVVELPAEDDGTVCFGATVTLRDVAGAVETYRIVGVDELRFEPQGVSWISPLGKTLLAAKLGDRITLEGGRSARIERVDCSA